MQIVITLYSQSKQVEAVVFIQETLLFLERILWRHDHPYLIKRCGFTDITGYDEVPCMYGIE
jgi:hypothetical protein